ncbi:MAG: c-type cytochrome biogenesis protein CcmI [Motiliproteus sp.]
MITFWLLTAVLIVIALVFFWVPFLKRPGSVETELDRNALNVEIFKSRQAELQQELEDGNLDKDAFQELKIELEKGLLVEVDDTQQHIDHQRPSILIPLSLTLLMPIVSVLLYMQWGALDDLGKEPDVVAEETAPHQMEDMNKQLETLRAELEASPDNPEGWFMLGRSYMTVERYQDSVDAFQRLIGLVGEHAEILSQQANALYMANNRRLTPETQAIIDKALQLDPKDSGTLGLLAMSSYEAGQYPEALNYWEQVLASGKPNVNREGLLAAIEQVKGVMDEQGISYQQTLAKADPAASGANLQVLVELDPGMSDKVSPDTVVFVLAQALQGPRMPLAAVKLKIKDLPKLVTLDDSQAMGPMAKLSSVEKVQIRALVSQAGTAAAKPGDLVGVSEPVTVKGSQGVIKLNINQVVE